MDNASRELIQSCASKCITNEFIKNIDFIDKIHNETKEEYSNLLRNTLFKIVPSYDYHKDIFMSKSDKKIVIETLLTCMVRRLELQDYNFDGSRIRGNDLYMLSDDFLDDIKTLFKYARAVYGTKIVKKEHETYIDNGSSDELFTESEDDDVPVSNTTQKS